MLILRYVKIQNWDSGAFCALREDGTVVAWGDQRRGGNTCAVEAHLTQVRSVRASAGAFAAVRQVEGPQVVCWGEQDAGGDCSQVREQLKETRSTLCDRWKLI